MLLRCALLLVAMLASGCVVGGSKARVESPPQSCAELGGPWTTWPEAIWVREIVEAGGYNVFAETGSALVASGKGLEFYVWTTEGAGPLAKEWRKLTTVKGTPLYGDRDVWRVWRAQGFNFWVKAGPRPTFAPAAGRLAPVIDASLRIPFRNDCEGSRPVG
jgi:hypothetical protein